MSIGRLNQDVLEYVHEELPKIMNRNMTFIEVFGRNFAKNRLIKNVQRVYTNKGDMLCNGFYVQKSITICDKGKFGGLLKVQDIINNKSTLQTLMHESIHALLYRTKEPRGTGILRFLGKSSEIGRGLNEGYTEWLCEKFGIEAETYEELTNIVRQLELAIGEKRTMELGKGTIGNRFCQILDMEPERVAELLANTDEIYLIEKKLNYLCEMKDNIVKRKGIKRIKRMIDASDMKGMEKYLKSLEGHSHNEMIEDITKDIKEERKLQQQATWNTEKIIFTKYFEEYFKKIEMKEGTEELLEKLGEFQLLLNSSKDAIPEAEKDSDFARFINMPITLRKRNDKVYDNNFRRRIKLNEVKSKPKKDPDILMFVTHGEDGIDIDTVDISRFE